MTVRIRWMHLNNHFARMFCLNRQLWLRSDWQVHQGRSESGCDVQAGRSGAAFLDAVAQVAGFPVRTAGTVSARASLQFERFSPGFPHPQPGPDVVSCVSSGAATTLARAESHWQPVPALDAGPFPVAAI